MNSFFLMCILGIIVTLGSSHIASAQDYPEDYVNLHNDARSAISPYISSVVWDNKIAAYAQNYANQRKDCKVIPSNNGGPYGENIAVSTGNLTGKEAVKLWLDEKPHYNHNLNKCEGGECSHYTQVIWEETSRIGCAKVKCNNGGTFVSCNYYPPGNVPGLAPY